MTDPTLIMTRRSLTLLETLIALVLVLALAALVMPSLLNSLGEREFESAASSTSEQLVMARAHAQTTGTPVEVTYRAGASQVQARLFTPWLLKQDSNSGAAARDPILSAADDTDAQAQASPSPLIGESWACRDLSRGVRLSSSPAKNTTAPRDGSMAMLVGDDNVETIEDLEKGQDVRLAVFMPDGSALVADPVWIVDEQGRRGVFMINPWSGMPTFQRLTDTQTPTGTDDGQDSETFDPDRSSSSDDPRSSERLRHPKGTTPGETDASPQQPAWRP